LPRRHDRGPGRQVDVGDPERCRFASTRPSLEHEPDQRLVPAVPQLPAGARLDQRLELHVRQRLGDLGVQLGRLDSKQRVDVDLAFLGEPGREASDTELTRPRGGRLRAAGEHVIDERGELPPVEDAGMIGGAAPAQVGAHAITVGLDRLRRLALGAQRQLPRTQQGGEVYCHGNAIGAKC